MKAVTIKQIKDELSYKSESELKELCLHLSRFKKDNKELLTYLLFESNNEEHYVESIKELMDELFEDINTKNYFFIRKSMRKILTQIKKYIRYSKKKETEAEILLYYCKKMKNFYPPIDQSVRLQSIFETQLRIIRKAIDKLHEDLQYDFALELEDLINEH